MVLNCPETVRHSFECVDDGASEIVGRVGTVSVACFVMDVSLDPIEDWISQAFDFVLHVNLSPDAPITLDCSCSCFFSLLLLFLRSLNAFDLLHLILVFVIQLLVTLFLLLLGLLFSSDFGSFLLLFLFPLSCINHVLESL